MTIRYDKKIDAMYIRLVKGKVDHTVPLTEDCMIDVDKKGNALAVELLDATRQLSPESIQRLVKKAIQCTSIRFDQLSLAQV